VKLGAVHLGNLLDTLRQVQALGERLSLFHRFVVVPRSLLLLWRLGIFLVVLLLAEDAIPEHLHDAAFSILLVLLAAAGNEGLPHETVVQHFVLHELPRCLPEALALRSLRRTHWNHFLLRVFLALQERDVGLLAVSERTSLADHFCRPSTNSSFVHVSSSRAFSEVSPSNGMLPR